MKKVALLICLILFLLPSVSSLREYEQFENISFVEIIRINGAPSDNIHANITFLDPNNLVLIGANEMTYNTTNRNFNFTLDSHYTTELGTYTKCIDASDTTGVANNKSVCENFLVTQTGRTFSTSQGIVSLGILASILFISFLFMLFASKLIENEKYAPFALFFIFFALAFIIYSLQLGYAYSSDILEYESLTTVQLGMYFVILFSVVGLGIISMCLMLIAFIKDLGKTRKGRSYGEGFNPITDTYDF